VPLEEIREPHGQLIAEETLRWDREDLWRIVSGKDYMRRAGVYLRSISSRVSCLVSLTKQKIMNQAMRLSPA
jgi:hypothetical protein